MTRLKSATDLSGTTSPTKHLAGAAYPTSNCRGESGITTMTVGLIAGYQQAEDIVASGKADLICLARAAIWDPRWAWHAAEELGAEAPYAPKTMAGHPKLRPQLFPKRAQAAG